MRFLGAIRFNLTRTRLCAGKDSFAVAAVAFVALRELRRQATGQPQHA
jgi:hypothetical protein